MPAGGTSYAQWSINSYTYTFDGNGATVAASPTSRTLTYGAALAEPAAAPTRTGYTFTSWSPSIPATMPLSGGTSVAQWTANPSATISAPDCDITAGNSSCNTTVSWNIQNATTPRAKQNGSDISTNPVSSQSRTLNYGTAYTFTATDNTTVLASDSASANCGSGTSWIPAFSRCDVAAPATPTGLTATPGSCDTGQIGVSWSSVPGATSYTLLDGATAIYSGTGNSYTHTGLSNGSSHTYSVRASNGGGDSSWSSGVAGSAPGACASCFGAEPQYSSICGGDNSGLSADTLNTLVNACTPGTKCEYTCTTGRVKVGSKCVAGSLSATQNPIPYGGTTVISWTSDSEVACTVTGPGDSWPGTSSAGEETAALTTDALYVLECGGTTVASITVDVLNRPTMTISPRIVEIGTEVNLTYNTNGQSCTLRGGGITPLSINTVVDTILTPKPIIRANTTYTITCQNSSVTTSTTVEIIPTGFET
jgi:hypothetical protein